jgi:nitroreductase
MNETLKTILSRRSVRNYNSTQIKDDELKNIVLAGIHAPSAINQQPWHFTVIQNSELLQKINNTCKAFLLKTNNKNYIEKIKNKDSEKFSILFDAPTLIIVSGNQNALAPLTDCSLALENMFLAAESMNVGSCWVYAINLLYNSEEGKAFLIDECLMPKDNILIGSAVFGYKAVEKSNTPPRKTDNVVYFR